MLWLPGQLCDSRPALGDDFHYEHPPNREILRAPACEDRGWRMTHLDTAYYRSRAEEEREAARNARDASAAAIHTHLAESYDALVRHPELDSGLKTVPA